MSTAALTMEGDVFDFIRRFVGERSAIVLEPSKTYLVDARLTPVAQRHGMTTVSDLVAALKRGLHKHIEQDVVEALTTNETSFYRDSAPFEALKKTVLPDMIARRGATRQLSIWSAACSSGQELYSIAMLLREHFPQLGGWSLKLLGTDLSTQMVERCKSATYTQAEVNRGLPATHLVKYFQRKGTQWKLNDDIRAMTHWQQLNLISKWLTVPPMDIVFLRNVLIYFSPETKRDILAQVRKVLRPDGYMFLGAAETTMNIDESFKRIACDGAVCYRAS